MFCSYRVPSGASVSAVCAFEQSTLRYSTALCVPSHHFSVISTSNCDSHCPIHARGRAAAGSSHCRNQLTIRQHQYTAHSNSLLGSTGRNEMLSRNCHTTSIRGLCVSHTFPGGSTVTARQCTYNVNIEARSR